MTADQVCAIIPTRGDVDLDEILASLPYPQVIIRRATDPDDQGIYSRYLAIEQTDRPVIYFQDDDVLFTAHDELLNAYEPGRLVVNMPSPWYERTQYDVYQQVQVGAGALMDRDLAWPAINRYLEHYPLDDLFRLHVDDIVGMLTPFTRHDFGYMLLPATSAPGRISTRPSIEWEKPEMRRRGLELRRLVNPGVGVEMPSLPVEPSGSRPIFMDA